MLGPRVDRRRDRGAAAVEFAIIFPLLFLILAGIIDFGRAFFTEIQLANAAREGARTAVLMPSPPNPAPSVSASISARVSAAAPGMSPSITPAVCASGASGDATVEVSTPFQWILLRPAILLFGGSWGTSGSLSSKAVMRCGG
jgi:Flp pilus assembly protein TadG